MTDRSLREGEVAIVTCASRGFGAASVRAFAEAGATVVLAARTAQAIATIAMSSLWPARDIEVTQAHLP